MKQRQNTDGCGETDFVTSGHNGEPQAIFNQQGELRWQAPRTNLWGQRYTDNTENLDPELAFAGQYRDAESGLCYNRFRYYEPSGGSYISPDPIGLAGGIRPQAYVHNPLEWVDPLGLDKKDPKFRSKSAEEMADELADKINKNSVNFSTTDSMGHIDLRGRSHFDKITQTDIPTPHVQTSQVNEVPGKGRFPLKKTEVARPATKQDIRTARKLAKRQGLLK